MRRLENRSTFLNPTGSHPLTDLRSPEGAQGHPSLQYLMMGRPGTKSDDVIGGSNLVNSLNWKAGEWDKRFEGTPKFIKPADGRCVVRDRA